MVKPILYQNVILKVPRVWENLLTIENLLASGAEGLRYTTGLTVITDSAKVDGEDMDCLPSIQVWVKADSPDLFGQRRFQFKVLNTLMRLILIKIPQHRLRHFM